MTLNYKLQKFYNINLKKFHNLFEIKIKSGVNLLFVIHSIEHSYK
jgi:hypothetical protein